MPAFTILTTDGTITAEGHHWARSDEGDVYVYPNSDTDSEPVAEVDAAAFVGIVATADGHVAHIRSKSTPPYGLRVNTETVSDELKDRLREATPLSDPDIDTLSEALVDLPPADHDTTE
jgi:hypothetical protein